MDPVATKGNRVAELEELVVEELRSNGPKRGRDVVRTLSDRGVARDHLVKQAVWRLLDRGAVQLTWGAELAVSDATANGR